MISLKSNVVRQSSDVMMGFDDGGFSADAALYNVWVDGSLYQEVYSTNFLCFFFEDADEPSPMILRFLSGSSTPFNFA